LERRVFPGALFLTKVKKIPEKDRETVAKATDFDYICELKKHTQNHTEYEHSD
jgi:hypothetical protein